MFKFQPKWKEILVVSGPGGEFCLEHPMGIPTVIFPDEYTYGRQAPFWAKDHWSQLKSELETWCQKEGIKFEIMSNASLWTDS